jgi:mersacidin/lichenicidin family type 2 lantibiotic
VLVGGVRVRGARRSGTSAYVSFPARAGLDVANPPDKGERTSSAERKDTMKKIDIARAWKDSGYRKTLTPEQLASLPANPVDISPMSDEEMKAVGGGRPRDTKYPDCCDNSTIGPKGG